MISIDEQRGVVLLSTNSSSYAFALLEHSYPSHLHWGDRIGSVRGPTVHQSGRRPFSVQAPVHGTYLSLGSLPSEYGWSGSGDFRIPSWEAVDEQGFPIIEPWHERHSIHPGKPALDGMPSSYTKAGDNSETLKVVLRDKPSGLAIHLRYTVFPTYDVITRSTVFCNDGENSINLTRAGSLCVDLDGSDFEVLSLHGAWGREAQLSRHALAPGVYSFGSRTGTTSHFANPFVALAPPSATEHTGAVRAALLMYSGNFRADVERTFDDDVRLVLGINPDSFSWMLGPGERFTTPEVLLVYSAAGLNGMSQIYHRFIRERVMPRRFQDAPRPIVANNWEATYFDFTHDSLLPLLDAAAQVGVELFVLDDGWFGDRESDGKSLGDWTVNRRKLPRGLEGLAADVAEHGLELGLWFEPEMVSPDSDLHRAHPDWCLHIPGREKPLGRNQLVLDLSRPEICREIIDRVSSVLESAPISYVKWDMNRYLSYPVSPSLPAERRKELSHRYVLGLYQIWDALTTRFPKVLFAGCSGGGGRFDAGVLSYFPQIWASDNSDAVDRLRIQYGLSLVYPVCAIEAHVTSIPNHQVGRFTPFSTRGNVALSANFGFELDLTALDDEDRRIAEKLVATAKKYRRLIHGGRFVRLESPFDAGSNRVAWMFVDEKARLALLFAFQLLSSANREGRAVPLVGLEPETLYRVSWLDSGDLRLMGFTAPPQSDPFTEGPVRCIGAELMGRGVELPRVLGDFVSFRFLIEAE